MPLTQGRIEGATLEPPPQAASGWAARILLQLEPRGERTVLARKQQQGPLTVQRAFYPEGAPCHLYLLHPPGGVVGGDQLEVRVQVAGGAHGLLTSPGAAKFYRSAGAMARQQQQLEVADGAVLEWLPQEVILFPGARVDLQSRVRLSGSGRFIGWEILSLGRPAVGERFERGRATLGLRLERDGRPLLAERLRVDSEQPGQAGLDAPSGLRGFPISATLVATGATAADRDAARALIPADAGLTLGITLLGDLLVVRALAHQVEPVLLGFRALWRGLRPRLLGLDACAPRIWST
jgi:urease accessory protein